MRIEDMKRRKRELGYTARQISDLSGVPLGTVQKIFSGHTKAPRYDTLRALEAVLRWESPELTRVPGKKQGEYTIADLEGFPEERRVELIDGVIYDLASPTGAHQIAVGFLHAELWNFIRSNQGGCVVNIAPTGVQPDPEDDTTLLEPDVLVTCDREKITMPGIKGAPDLVIEVLSPSTRKRDLLLKTGKYEQAGVRELWLVDHMNRRVLVYDFEHGNVVSMYGFRDKVPVLIFDGVLTIDFGELSDYLDELFGDEWWEQ
ncbi:MAG: Uma2 family endonuclease [Firmicutes bacterium]|nr:Uma2 family endonuclease [Bacillota bacterium]